MKKFLALALVAVMMLSFTACGGEKVDLIETDTSKPVTLNWVMPGPGMQKDSEMVWAKFNEELKKVEGFENVTVEIEVIPFADYAQKILLMQTSGEPMDLMQTYGLNYASEYFNGSFLDMAPYLKKYAKDAIKEMPEWVFEMGKVDGAQAILPNYQKMTEAPFYMTIPAEFEQYADIEKIQAAFIADKDNDYVPSKASRDAVEEYLEKVYASGVTGRYYVAATNPRAQETVHSHYKVSYLDPTAQVYNVYLSKQMQEGWLMKQHYFEKGYVRKDALSAKEADYNGTKGGNLMWTSQNWTGKFEPYYGHKGYDIDVIQIPVMDQYFIPHMPAAGGLAIPVNSECPDIAAKLINLMCSSKGIDLYNLLVYGIEGVHYTVDKELDGKDKMITPKDYPEEGNAAAAYGLNKWIVGNAKLAYVTSNQPENFKEIIYDIMNEGENTQVSYLMGFALDTTSIDTKLAQINAVRTEYAGPASSGVLDTQKLIDEMTEKMKTAGDQEVVDEIQRQIDEFLAQK